MSRSNNTEITNPAVRFFKFSGDKGKFKYFDKERGEKGEEVFINLPFRFLVLDNLSTITGYCDADESGFWSNEVRNTKKEPLTVRTKKGIWIEGYYSHFKDSLGNAGGDFCQSIYIAFNDENNNLCIGNIKLRGAANSAWIDFRKKNKVFEGAVVVNRTQEATKGSTIYQIPVFEKIATKPETEEKAIALDKELQEYLNAYFERKGQQNIKEEEVKAYDAPPASLAANEPSGEPTKETPPASSSWGPEPDDLPF
jgi:hypothetical protein